MSFDEYRVRHDTNTKKSSRTADLPSPRRVQIPYFAERRGAPMHRLLAESLYRGLPAIRPQYGYQHRAIRAAAVGQIAVGRDGALGPRGVWLPPDRSREAMAAVPADKPRKPIVFRDDIGAGQKEVIQ